MHGNRFQLRLQRQSGNGVIRGRSPVVQSGYCAAKHSCSFHSLTLPRFAPHPLSTLPTLQMTLFNLKLYSLNKENWKRRRAHHWHRIYWRSSALGWSMLAVYPGLSVSRQFAYPHAVAFAFCIVIAIDCVAWSCAADRCKRNADCMELGFVFAPKLVALFNVKSACEYATTNVRYVRCTH